MPRLWTGTAGAAWAVIFLARAAPAQTMPDAPAAAEKPLLEIGALGAGASLPDYPGSAQNHG